MKKPKLKEVMKGSGRCLGAKGKPRQRFIHGRSARFVKDTHEFVYMDGESCEHTRPCPKCRLPCKLGEPDPCLGYLPGVLFACCGHGRHEGYILFENGVRIEFDARKIWKIPEQVVQDAIDHKAAMERSLTIGIESDE